MNPIRTLLAVASIIALMMVCNHCHAQVVVNGRNLNSEGHLQYVQLMYYIEKASIKPVFYIDFGFIEPEYNDILEPDQLDYQKITINGKELTDRVTVVWVLNEMHRAGWEYMGDVVFIPLKVMNNWHVYTMKRRNAAQL